MSTKLFIADISYDSSRDAISVAVHANATLVAFVDISFATMSIENNQSVVTTTFEPDAHIEGVDVANSAVLGARVISVLDRLSTDEQDIHLLIEVDENNPIEI